MGVPALPGAAPAPANARRTEAGPARGGCCRELPSSDPPCRPAERASPATPSLEVEQPAPPPSPPVCRRAATPGPAWFRSLAPERRRHGPGGARSGPGEQGLCQRVQKGIRGQDQNCLGIKDVRRCCVTPTQFCCRWVSCDRQLRPVQPSTSWGDRADLPLPGPAAAAAVTVAASVSNSIPVAAAPQPSASKRWRKLLVSAHARQAMTWGGGKAQGTSGTRFFSQAVSLGDGCTHPACGVRAVGETAASQQSPARLKNKTRQHGQAPGSVQVERCTEAHAGG